MVDGCGLVVELGLKAVEDPVAAFKSCRRVAERIEPRGSLGEAGEEGGFGERKVGERFVEEEAGGGGTALAVGTVVESVEVSSEDFVL